ncbi:MAG TPA: coniferyl-alcohol dehydrogenase [Mycobacteriales bacterium]|nr:coniferyl-alcohol dehydrogenase [Mycobacteriales bacterium]
MDGKRCVVTGAASGIGDAVARLLVERGASVVSLDRNSPSAPVEAHVAVDLTDLASIEEALSQLDGEFDVLCNVAGLPGTHPAEAVFRVNFLAARHIAEAFFDRLRPGGAIVNVASTAGFGWPDRIDTIRDLMSAETYDEGLVWFKENPQQGNMYNFSKEALTVYTMAMATGLVEAGVRMNAVSPGPVETPILVDFEESMGKDIIDGVKELVGRHATPLDIAKVVAFLASSESGWVNGHNIIADGGIAGAVLTGIVPAPEI